jgi:hypothetical protein
MPNGEDFALLEAEENRRVRVNELHAEGRTDDEMEAREELFLLTDALAIAKRSAVRAVFSSSAGNRNHG